MIEYFRYYQLFLESSKAISKKCFLLESIYFGLHQGGN